MPTYDYLCQDCEHKLEAFHKITDIPLKSCPKCRNDSLQRIPGGGIGLSFKGSGFYHTDYVSKGESGEQKTSEAPSQKKEAACCPCGKNTSCKS